MRKILFLFVALLSVMAIHAQDENTFVTDDGMVSIAYPASWFVAEDGDDLIFANSEAALGRSGDLIEPGDASGRILIFPFDVLEGSGLEASSTTLEFASLFLDVLEEESNTQFAEPTIFDAGGTDGIFTTGTIDADGKGVDAYITIVKDDEAFALLMIVADGGDPAEIEQILMDVSASFNYGASIPPNSISATDPNAGDFTISHPDGWVYEMVGGGQIQIANSEDALRNFVDNNGVPLEDQVGASVLALPKDVMPQLGEYPDTPDGVLAFLQNAFANDEVFDVVFDEPMSLTINDRPAAMVYGELSQAEGDYDVMLIAADADTLYGVFAFVAATGTITDYEQLAIETAASFRAGSTGNTASSRISTENLTNSINTLDPSGSFISINYPTDWTADVIEGEIVFGNSPDAVVNLVGAGLALQPGDIAGNVAFVPYSQIVAMGFDESTYGAAAFAKQIVFESDSTATGVNEPVVNILDDLGIVSVSGTVTDGSLTLDVIVTMTDTTGGYLLILLGMDEGTAPDMLELAIQIASTATLQ